MCHNDALPEYPSTSIKTLLQVERVGLVSQSGLAGKGHWSNNYQQIVIIVKKKGVVFMRGSMSILNAWSTLCMIDSSRAKVAIVASRMRKLAPVSLRQRQYRVLELVARAAASGHLAHFPFALWSYVCSRDRRGVSIINERDGVCESFSAKNLEMLRMNNPPFNPDRFSSIFPYFSWPLSSVTPSYPILPVFRLCQPIDCCTALEHG